MALLPPSQRQALIAKLSTEEAEGLLYDWKFWARPNQLPPPGDWLTWLVLAGRGFGKTWIGAHWVRDNVCGKTPLAGGRFRRVAMVAETSADARDVLVEGDSGLLAVHPPAFRPLYEPSKRRVTWPNGATAALYNAVEPDQLRGPEHDAAVSDELAKWRYAQETWDMLQFGLRGGTHPQQIITTTPKPIKLLRTIMADPTTVVTRGSTYENRANLAPAFLKTIIRRYEGTRLGRQELDAELLEDIPGALWQRQRIDELRVATHPPLRRIVVAIDPAGGAGDDNDETGIVVAGVAVDQDHGYVLADLSMRGSPDAWARSAVNAYHRLKADRIVAEVNFGGDMVEHTIRSVDPSVAFKRVAASRGKVVRAEPIAALDEQGRVHHVGSFPELEDQMCAFTSDFKRATAGFSPDRVDARVWALTELMKPTEDPRIRAL